MLKLHSSRLKKEKWNLHITLQEARRNEELIALSDSNTLRMIDAINGVKDVDKKAAAIQKEIRYIKKLETSKANRRRIRDLYTELDNLLYKPDYMCLIIDRDADYDKACESGFTINDIHYERLLGTNGGVKNSTIVFVSSRVAPELKRRLKMVATLTKRWCQQNLSLTRLFPVVAPSPFPYPVVSAWCQIV